MIDVLKNYIDQIDIEAEINNVFAQKFAFMFFSENIMDENDEGVTLYICIKNHQEDILLTWSAWAQNMSNIFSEKFNKNIYIKIVKVSKLRDLVNYAWQVLPSEIIHNSRIFEGLSMAITFASRPHFIAGRKELFDNFIEIADCVVLHWARFFEIEDSENSVVELKNIIEYRPLKRKILENAKKLYDVIEKNQDAIKDILVEMETYQVACDEIHGCLDTLGNMDKQLANLRMFEGKVSNVSVFLPLNLPLYSFVLYACVVGFAVENVYIRCPVLPRKVLGKLYDLLNFAELLPHIHVLEMERSEFREKYVARSDVIIFTGKYENANELLNKYSDKLFIFNGYGINPIVVGKDVNVSQVARKSVDMRLYNSGQDCTAPDAIIVHESIVDEFVDALIQEVKDIPIGDFADKSTRIGKTLRSEVITDNMNYLRGKEILYGGLLDYVRGIMHPTIIKTSIKSPRPYEFFAPIFNIVPYSSESELEKYFNHKAYKTNSMYVSVFGNVEVLQNADHSVILKDKIILDIDCGYEPFGGYGKRANFIHYKGKKESYPVLIPRDIARYIS